MKLPYKRASDTSANSLCMPPPTSMPTPLLPKWRLMCPLRRCHRRPSASTRPPPFRQTRPRLTSVAQRLSRPSFPRPPVSPGGHPGGPSSRTNTDLLGLDARVNSGNFDGVCSSKYVPCIGAGPDQVWPIAIGSKPAAIGQRRSNQVGGNPRRALREPKTNRATNRATMGQALRVRVTAELSSPDADVPSSPHRCPKPCEAHSAMLNHAGAPTCPVLGGRRRHAALHDPSRARDESRRSARRAKARVSLLDPSAGTKAMNGRSSAWADFGPGRFCADRLLSKEPLAHLPGGRGKSSCHAPLGRSPPGRPARRTRTRPPHPRPGEGCPRATRRRGSVPSRVPPHPGPMRRGGHTLGHCATT